MRRAGAARATGASMPTRPPRHRRRSGGRRHSHPGRRGSCGRRPLVQCRGRRSSNGRRTRCGRPRLGSLVQFCVQRVRDEDVILAEGEQVPRDVPEVGRARRVQRRGHLVDQPQHPVVQVVAAGRVKAERRGQQGPAGGGKLGDGVGGRAGLGRGTDAGDGPDRDGADGGAASAGPGDGGRVADGGGRVGFPPDDATGIPVPKSGFLCWSDISFLCWLVLWAGGQAAAGPLCWLTPPASAAPSPPPAEGSAASVRGCGSGG